MEVPGRFADTSRSCQASSGRCGGLQELGLSSLRGRRNPFGTKLILLLPWRSQQFFEKAKVWNRHGKSIRLYREGNLHNAYVRAGDVTPELAPVGPAEESWARMEVDDGDRDEQDEANQPDELQESLSCLPACRAGEAEALSDESCCVCTSKRNRSTTQETDNQGTGKARTG